MRDKAKSTRPVFNCSNVLEGKDDQGGTGRHAMDYAKRALSTLKSVLMGLILTQLLTLVGSRMISENGTLNDKKTCEEDHEKR